MNLLQVIQSENIVMVDVDGTLIDHVRTNGVDLALADNAIFVQDPIHADKEIALTVNHPMVRLVKEEAARGSYIVVWSRGGYKWAETIITALGLEDSVKMIMSKPLVYFDDVPVEEWLPYRVFLKPDTIYKQTVKGD